MARRQAATKYGPGFWVAFALACATSAGLEHAMSGLFDESRGSPLLGTIFRLDTVYQRLVTAGPRPVTPRYTVLVEIRSGVEPSTVSLTNVCNQRELIARVVRTLRTSPRRPTVVAIDKFFGADSCPPEDAGTAALRTELSAALDAGIGVVVGRALVEAPDGAIRAEPAFDFGLGGSPRFKEGVVNVQPEVHTVPLSWTFTTEGSSTPNTAQGFALAAATLHRPDLVDSHRVLQRYNASGEPLHVSFLYPEQFESRRIAAMTLVCGPAPVEDWRGCTGTPPVPVPDVVGGGIVIVGEDFRDYDRHHTPIGSVVGYLLQASYVEALLDDRFFRSVPAWVNWAGGFLILLVFESVFVRYHHPFSILWRAAAIFVGAIAVAFALVALTGFLVAPVTVSVLGIILRSLSLFTKPFEQR